MKNIFYPSLIIILITIIITGCVQQKATTRDISEHKIHSIPDISNIPKSHKECSEQKSYISNNLVCYYDFIIQNNDDLWNFCKENGRVLSPNPPDPSTCRLSYYDSASKIPKNFDECFKLIEYSYDRTQIRYKNFSETCIFRIDMGEKTMTAETKASLFKQCSNYSNLDNNLIFDKSNEYCVIKFYK